MTFQEESPSVGVFTHRANGPIAGLEVEGRLGEDGVDRVGPGDGRPRLCAGSDVSPHRLRPVHFPDRRVLHTGQDPMGEALPPLPRALGIAEPSKAKQGDLGAWGSSCEPWRLASPPPLLLVGIQHLSTSLISLQLPQNRCHQQHKSRMTAHLVESSRS